MRYCIAFFCLVLFASVNGQSIQQIAESQYQINRTGMLLLGSWAIANIGVGIYGNSQFNGDKKYFYQMNGLWNTVNLGLATIGYLGAKDMLNDPSFNSILDTQMSMEKILLVNTGLDVGYIMTGFFLKERSKNVSKNSDRLLGYGNGLILQGAFLLLFDTVMYEIHHTNALKIMEFSKNVSLLYSGSGLSISFRL